MMSSGGFIDKHVGANNRLDLITVSLTSVMQTIAFGHCYIVHHSGVNEWPLFCSVENSVSIMWPTVV